jgi:extradiol dioxygenase family protein
MIAPFHLAVPVSNLEVCRTFYRDIIGCEEGRSSEQWVDFNFFGHQFVIHLKPGSVEGLHTNMVDGKAIPVPHFGVVLPWNEFKAFSNRLKSKNISFIIEPYIRFKGQIGEQATMFFYDPSGNALEFKSFKNNAALFAK